MYRSRLHATNGIVSLDDPTPRAIPVSVPADGQTATVQLPDSELAVICIYPV